MSLNLISIQYGGDEDAASGAGSSCLENVVDENGVDTGTDHNQDNYNLECLNGSINSPKKHDELKSNSIPLLTNGALDDQENKFISQKNTLKPKKLETVNVNAPDLSKPLPFTRCRIVLSMKDDGETSNSQSGWKWEQSENKYVFNDTITPFEKLEMKKSIWPLRSIGPPVNQRKGEINRVPAKVAVPLSSHKLVLEKTVTTSNETEIPEEETNKGQGHHDDDKGLSPPCHDHTTPVVEIYNCPYCLQQLPGADALIDHLKKHKSKETETDISREIGPPDIKFQMLASGSGDVSQQQRDTTSTTSLDRMKLIEGSKRFPKRKLEGLRAFANANIEDLPGNLRAHQKNKDKLLKKKDGNNQVSSKNDLIAGSRDNNVIGTNGMPHAELINAVSAEAKLPKILLTSCDDDNLLPLPITTSPNGKQVQEIKSERVTGKSGGLLRRRKPNPKFKEIVQVVQPSGEGHQISLYKCKLCGKFLSHLGNMIRHIKVIHLKEMEFPCPSCPKRYSSQQNLQAHMFMHAGLAPYKCTLCPKAFNYLSNMKRHMKFHSGLKPHKCTYCSKAFTLLQDVKKHQLLCPNSPNANKKGTSNKVKYRGSAHSPQKYAESGAGSSCFENGVGDGNGVGSGTDHNQDNDNLECLIGSRSPEKQDELKSNRIPDLLNGASSLDEQENKFILQKNTFKPKKLEAVNVNAPDLSKPLPFTRCRIVLSMKDDEETSNSQSGWNWEQSENKYVFKDTITPLENMEMKKSIWPLRSTLPSVNQRREKVKRLPVKAEALLSSHKLVLEKTVTTSNKTEIPEKETNELQFHDDKGLAPHCQDHPCPVVEIYNCPYCLKPLPGADALIKHLKKHRSKETKTDGSHGIGPPKIKFQMPASAPGDVSQQQRDMTTTTSQCLDKTNLNEGNKAFPQRKLEGLRKFVNANIKYLPENGQGYSQFNSACKCKMCGKTFSTKSNAAFHIKTVHWGERRFNCTTCPKKFNSRQHLKQHTLSHTRKKPCQSKSCSKQFTLPSSLNLPMKVQAKLQLEGHQKNKDKLLKNNDGINKVSSKNVLMVGSRGNNVIDRKDARVINAILSPSTKLPKILLARCDDDELQALQITTSPNGKQVQEIKSEMANNKSRGMSGGRKPNTKLEDNVQVVQPNGEGHQISLYKCKICGQIFLQKVTVATHIKAIHWGEGRFT